MKKAALICVTRNNAEKLQTTLNSIIQNTKAEDYDLIIIDNASSDSTLGIYQLPVLADNITIVRSGKNLNWVGGINLGLEMTRGYRYVGFLNDDIEVCPNWLENFFDVLDCNPDVAAVGPLTSNSRDWQGYDRLKDQYQLAPMIETNRADVAAMHREIQNNGAGIFFNDPLSFACVLFRRNAIEQVGSLDNAFIETNCGENEDYCFRLLDAGMSLALSMKTYARTDPAFFCFDSEPETEAHLQALKLLDSKFRKVASQLDESRLKSGQCRHGFFIFDKNDTYVGRSLEAYGEWAEAEVQLFSQIIRPTDTVVEVGANIGSHTLAIARLASEGRVHAFEPQPYVFSMLQKNVSNNDLKNITLWNAAVGSEVGRVSMPFISASCYSQVNFGAVSIHTQSSRRVGVALLAIDYIQEIQQIDFLKIDVEGFEPYVLDGAKSAIQKFRPIVFIESQNLEDHTSAINRFFDPLGYTTWHYNTLIYNPENFQSNSENIFGRQASYDLLCLPPEKIAVEGLVSGSEPAPLLPDDYWKQVKITFHKHSNCSGCL
jgi:FkbM family methyltransferase